MLPPGESSHYRAAYFLLTVPKSVSYHICDGWPWPCAAHISLPGKACCQGVQRTDGLQASSCSALGICPFEPSLCSSRAAPANRAQHLYRDLAMPAQPTLQPLLGHRDVLRVALVRCSFSQSSLAPLPFPLTMNDLHGSWIQLICLRLPQYKHTQEFHALWPICSWDLIFPGLKMSSLTASVASSFGAFYEL